MYDVWIAEEENGRFSPVTKVPQHHQTVEEAFGCACRMLKLMGAEFLQARNTNVLGVHPTQCILVFDPDGNPTPQQGGNPMAAIIVGGELVDDKGKHTLDATTLHTTHHWH